MKACHVSRQIADHAYQIGVDQARGEAINAEMLNLIALGKACDPFAGENLSEAFGALTDAQLERLSGFLRLRRFDELGAMLTHEFYAYWLTQAEIMAEKAINAGIEPDLYL